MSVKDRINCSKLFPQGLLSKIGTAVNKETAPRSFKKNRAAGAIIVRVVGAANVAGATDDGDSHRGGSAEKEEAGG